MKFSRHGLAIFTLILAMLACNLPSTEQATPPSDAQTAAAMTVQSLLVVTPATLTSTVSPTVIAATISATVTPGSKATITPTYSAPILTVKEQTNCRKGPGQDYEIVFTYLPGKKLVILGRYDPGNFWLVKSDESPSGQCWLWGEYVEVVGSYWVVPSVTPPPTSTKAPPQAPAFQKWTYFCSFNGVNNDLNVTLIWTDRADNETGYRIIRDGEQIAELPANTTTYTDVVAVDTGESANYRVDVYNSTGTSSSTTVPLKCE